jgi:CDP-diacylglycerol--serine O-phosphatidyltransferase
LDSLADFLNFGVAPALILYVWALQEMPGPGWIAALFYSICCVMRLARFNVSSKSETVGGDSDFFVGVPAPAGAVLAMLPMFASFLAHSEPGTAAPLLPTTLSAAYLVGVGLLMISRIPTYSFKKVAIRRDKSAYVVLGVVLLVLALLTYLWATLVFLTIIYIAGILWAQWARRGTRP